MKKAFSLVEILVVVTIISILASIAAVSYSRFVKQSRDSRRKTDIEQIRAAVELYRNFKGAYPTPIPGPGTTGVGMSFGAGNIADEDTDPDTIYMSKIPTDPMANSSSAYYYYYDSTSPTFQDYTLCAFMEGVPVVSSGPSCGLSLCNYCMGPYGEK